LIKWATVDGPQYNVPSTRYQVRSVDSKPSYKRTWLLILPRY